MSSADQLGAGFACMLVTQCSSVIWSTVMLPCVGYSQAPDLYMGYGQAKDAPAMYTFEYPADWEEDTPTKTEKSTMSVAAGVSAQVVCNPPQLVLQSLDGLQLWDMKHQ